MIVPLIFWLVSRRVLIVDVGSGLGYVDQILSDVFSFDVVGVESHQGHAEAARIRNLKLEGLKSFRPRHVKPLFIAL